MSDGAAEFAALLQIARRDPNILAFWLGGSRGKGRGTEHSDHDCALVVADAVFADYQARHARLGGGLDCLVFARGAFEAYAAWGGPQAWDRYSFAHIHAEVDKTGDIQPLIEAKACVPADAITAFVNARLDHFLNQVYRSAKCRRDGDDLASRWEAAEGVSPLLDSLFALNNGRLRPFPKYLAWELETFPLPRSPWSASALTGLLHEVLQSGSVPAQQALLAGVETLARDDGHGAVFDGWGEMLPWMRGGAT